MPRSVLHIVTLNGKRHPQHAGLRQKKARRDPVFDYLFIIRLVALAERGCED
jgi:hypothetical protein